MDSDIQPIITPPPGLRLAARRFLVVEDEMTVAMLIEDIVNELSFEIAGVVSRLEDAMRLADSEAFDLALLDVHLGGKTVFPFAAELDKREIPYLFVTAYGRRGIPAQFQGHPVLEKPFGPLELSRALTKITSGA